MKETDLAAAVQNAVDEWMRATPPAQQYTELENPAMLSAKLAEMVDQALTESGFVLRTARQCVVDAPYFHLKRVFVPAGLPATPEWFTPVPDAGGSIAGRASVLAVHGFLRMETVSYGTENDGALFVNLVPIPGDGKYAKKSQGSMRGHTDAVSFPFNGEVDLMDSRVAPSPDLVTLVGLRNPNSVATKVMVLDSVLSELSPTDIEELKKPQYSFNSQATFVLQMKKILGKVHTAINEPVLREVTSGIQVRYSHSSVQPTELDGAAHVAADNFEAACDKVAISVVIEPGDVLVISNRLCLHGRAEVGDEIGGTSRWLLRTYGLETSNLESRRRHHDGRPSYVLFP